MCKHCDGFLTAHRSKLNGGFSPAKAEKCHLCAGQDPTLFSSGLFHAQSEALDHHVSHDEFLYLAGDRHRKLVDKFNVAWNLVVCDLSPAIVLELLDGSAYAGAQLYPRAKFLAESWIRNAKTRHSQNLG